MKNAALKAAFFYKNVFFLYSVGEIPVSRLKTKLK